MAPAAGPVKTAMDSVGPDIGPRRAVETKMAADIAELRSIVLAAAKHFKVDFPNEKDGKRPNSPDRDFLDNNLFLFPSDEGYDEETTIRHLMHLVPTELARTLHDFEPDFGDLPPDKLKIGPRDWPETAQGWQTLAEWSLHGGVSQDIREYGYVKFGQICDLDTYLAPGFGRPPRIYSGAYTERAVSTTRAFLSTDGALLGALTRGETKVY